MLTEAGPKPRLLEVDRTGQVVVEFPLACQPASHHMQTRMVRKLTDGTYLAPHLFDFAVKHYDASGKVLGQFDTTAEGDAEHKIHTWPFTRELLSNVGAWFFKLGGFLQDSINECVALEQKRNLLVAV